MCGANDTHGTKSAYWVLVGKHERSRLCGRPRHRREASIKIYFTEVGWETIDWINLD